MLRRDESPGKGFPMFANLLYLAALLIASPVVMYRAIRHGRYRRGIRQKLLGLSTSDAQRLRGDASSVIWLHAVSVGEVNLLPGLSKQLHDDGVDLPIVVSTSTDAGYDLAVKRFGADRVFFCPLDFTWSVSKTLRRLNPQLLVLAELELWPNLIRLAKQNGCNVTVINGRLSERSCKGYERFGLLVRSTFARLDRVACQDETTASRFIACGASPSAVSVTGSLKFDGASPSRDQHEVQDRLHWTAATAWHRIWCFGSTQSGEEQLALQVYQHLSLTHQELRLILVPRHPERFDAVARQIESAGLKVLRRSCSQSMGRSEPESFESGQTQWPSDTVVLIDTIGELTHWWGVAPITTVGGSFGDRGGQNMLEPAGYGCAVSFGPNTKNFRDIANQLLSVGGAVRVHDADELQQFVQRCLADPPAADSLGRAARQFVQSQQGATKRTSRLLVEQLAEPTTVQTPLRRAAA